MTSVPYLYQEYQWSTVGAVAPLSEVVGGQQRLTKEAAKAIHLLLSNKVATPVSSSKIAANGQIIPLPGYDPSVDADFVTYKFYVASASPPEAGNVLTKAENVMLVDLKAAQDNIMGTPTDLTVIVAKNATSASLLSQAGSPLAVLVPFDQVVSTTKEDKPGIKPAAIIGAIVGGGVGFLVAGPVGAIVGGIGTGVLVQQVA